MLASSADVLEALACVLEVQADGREDQNRPRNRQNQLDDDLDGPEQQAVDQSIKNPAEQAEKKASAIRADEAPELAQKVGHSPRFCRRRWKAKVLFSKAGAAPTFPLVSKNSFASAASVGQNTAVSEPVSLYIITYNEANNLCEVLPTVLWADEVVVVDSFSTDDTATSRNPF